MTLEPKRVDVTDRVVGRLKGQNIELYLDNQRIGTMSLPKGTQVQMEPRFSADNQKVFEQYMSADNPEGRYTDCDEGGWC